MTKFLPRNHTKNNLGKLFVNIYLLMQKIYMYIWRNSFSCDGCIAVWIWNMTVWQPWGKQQVTWAVYFLMWWAFQLITSGDSLPLGLTREINISLLFEKSSHCFMILYWQDLSVPIILPKYKLFLANFLWYLTWKH